MQPGTCSGSQTHSTFAANVIPEYRAENIVFNQAEKRKSRIPKAATTDGAKAEAHRQLGRTNIHVDDLSDDLSHISRDHWTF